MSREVLNIEIEAAPVVPVCQPIESISLTDEEIVFLEVLTLHSTYCFARAKTGATHLTRWQAVSGRPEIIGKTVHLFGINEDGKIREVKNGGRLGIYCFNSNALTWHTSKILSLAVAMG